MATVFGLDTSLGGDAKKRGLKQAGDAAAGLGSYQRDWEEQQGNTAMGFYGGNYGGSGGATDYYSGGPNSPQYAAPTGTPGATAGARSVGATVGSQFGGGPGGRGGGGTGTQQPAQYGVLDALKDERNNRPQQQQQVFDYMQGQVGQKTNQETLYDERKGGYDPAAQYQDKRATEGINAQLAARGRFNSGPGVRQVSDYLANANAQRSQQLASLAGGADSSRLGLDSAYGAAGTGASGEESKYFGDLTKGYQTADDAMASTFGHYSDRAGQAYSEGQTSKIAAQMQAAGVDAETIKAYMGLAVKGGGAIAAAAA